MLELLDACVVVNTSVSVREVVPLDVDEDDFLVVVAAVFAFVVVVAKSSKRPVVDSAVVESKSAKESAVVAVEVLSFLFLQDAKTVTTSANKQTTAITRVKFLFVKDTSEYNNYNDFYYIVSNLCRFVNLERIAFIKIMC